MKSILAIHPSNDLYGADRIFTQCIKHLLGQKYNVSVIIPNGKKLTKFLQKNNINDIIQLKYLPVAIRSRAGIKYYFRYIIDNIIFILKTKNVKNYDMVYLNTFALFSLCIIFKVLYRKFIVVHCHEMISRTGMVAKIVVQLNYIFADRIIAVSNAVKEDILCGLFWRSTKNKVFVIHNGIDVDRQYSPQSISSIRRFILVGRIMPEKGQWFVLDALRKLTNLDNVKVLFVGSPPPYRIHLMDDLKQSIKLNGLERVVRVEEYVENPLHLVAESDVCLIPSKMLDPFPTTVIEAMACGKPVIITNGGGAKEIVKDKVNGIVIDINNVEQLKNAIEYFISISAIDYDIISKNNRETYLNYLTSNAFKKRFLDFISSLFNSDE